MCLISTPTLHGTGSLLRIRKVGQALHGFITVLADFSFIELPSEPFFTQYFFVYLLSLLVTLTYNITSFQLSGKRLLMNSFGKSQQQDQSCTTTLM